MYSYLHFSKNSAFNVDVIANQIMVDKSYQDSSVADRIPMIAGKMNWSGCICLPVEFKNKTKHKKKKNSLKFLTA